MIGRAVEVAVRSLRQRAIGVTPVRAIAEVLERAEVAPVRVQLERGPGAAGAAVDSRAVERAVGPLRQPGEGVSAGGGIVEVLDRAEAAPVRVQLEHGAVAAAAAELGRAVERAAGPLRQPPEVGVPAGGVVVEVLERGEAGPVRVQLEHRADAAGAALIGRAVERAVRPLYRPGKGVTASGAHVTSG